MVKSNTGVLIDRAINELRTGRPIIIQENDNFWFFTNIEHSSRKIINKFQKYLDNDKFLLLTKQKAEIFFQQKLNTNVFLKINNNDNDHKYINLFLNPPSQNNLKFFTNMNFKKAETFHNVCLDLSKNAKMIPSLVFKKIKPLYYGNINNLIDKLSLLKFNFKDLKNQNKHISESIKLISSANVPLPNEDKTTFNIFKSYIGSRKHIAVIIKPSSKAKITNLRIHSACFTGDIFHSLKCDCGEQLNQSINYMIRNKGGVILYLDQEGRGIGLANKMRAYSLQSKGLDTIDADNNIGFLDDERDFNVASKILTLLKIKKVNIITNNSSKISAVEKAGIKIINQIHTKPTLNKFNKQYFQTRIKKTGYDIKI